MLPWMGENSCIQGPIFPLILLCSSGIYEARINDLTAALVFL